MLNFLASPVMVCDKFTCSHALLVVVTSPSLLISYPYISLYLIFLYLSFFLSSGISVTILFPCANHPPLFQHGRHPSHSKMFQKHALACFFLLTRIYYLHAFNIMLTMPIPCLSPHAQRSHSMPIPHYLHIVCHMHSMLVLHYLHTHAIHFPYSDHAFPSI